MSEATSAGPSKWAVLAGALAKFLADPASASIGAGIGFLGIQTSARRHQTESCNAADYAQPVVSIAPLSTHADTIVSALKNYTPQGHTPTYPALQGAIQCARRWAADHKDHKVVVVLATDGLPNWRAAAQLPANGPVLPTRGGVLHRHLQAKRLRIHVIY